MDAASTIPQLELYSQVESDEAQLEWLLQHLTKSLPLVLENPGTGEPVLPVLETVEITLISDETIAEVHEEFLDDPTPTDVITFHHGEILVSRETAEREATEYGKTADEETLLYGIHGLLHLNGHTDLEEPERGSMHRIQEDILSRILSEGASGRLT